ncbi:MAG TPA: extracellular solute-binding protein [Patescibacteria group bacterium]|nr:extracellular solute-binding protein [Patescibacteria group bacterium]
MKNKIRKKKIILSFFSLILIFSLSGCLGGSEGTSPEAAYQDEQLIWWGVWDNEDDVEPLIDTYRQLHPNVDIAYRKLRFEEYEDELLNALAEGRGPDIFSVHNTWMKKYQRKISPLPSTTSVPIKYVKEGIKKEEITEWRTNRSLTPAQVRRNFVEVVAGDVLMDDPDQEGYNEQIWGLPTSLDTMVLYYNKDLFNRYGVIEPPANWNSFQEAVKKITRIDGETEEILTSGAAIGTADNVVRSFDLLSLLMMQNMTDMLSNREAVFDQVPADLEVEVPPGIGALDYYVQFASPLYEGYTWNNNMPNSLEAFIQGRTAMFFGYAYHRPEIKARNPQLNFSIAPVPQVGEQQKVNYANYWVQVVSKQTEIENYAWDFVQFITDEENIMPYLQEVKKPTALRSTEILNNQLENEEMAVFADQVLTAKSWYKGYNSTGAEQAFSEMINNVLAGNMNSEEAVEQAIDKVNYSIRNR